MSCKPKLLLIMAEYCGVTTRLNDNAAPQFAVMENFVMRENTVVICASDCEESVVSPPVPQ